MARTLEGGRLDIELSIEECRVAAAVTAELVAGLHGLKGSQLRRLLPSFLIPLPTFAAYLPCPPASP